MFTPLQLNAIEADLAQNNWKKSTLGVRRNNTIITPLDKAIIFTKSTHIGTVRTHGAKTHFQNPSNSNVSSPGSGSTMGRHKSCLTPQGSGIVGQTNFSLFKSLQAIRSNDKVLTIAYDSEWENNSDGSRTMLTYQFAYVQDDNLVEVCFLLTGDKRLSLDEALSVILNQVHCKSVDVRRVLRFQCCTRWEDKTLPDGTTERRPVIDTYDDWRDAWRSVKSGDGYAYLGYGNGGYNGWSEKTYNELENDYYAEMIARRKAKLKGIDRKDVKVLEPKEDFHYFHKMYDFSSIKERINVCLVCHAGAVDLSGLGYIKHNKPTYDDSGICPDNSRYIFKRLTDIQKGLCSMQATYIPVKDLTAAWHSKVFCVSIDVADTMCHAPAGQKSLSHLGDVVGVPKISVPVSRKSHMLQFLLTDPSGFMDYASRDSVVTLLYISSLYGFNRKPPLTITSATAKVMKGTMMDYLGTTNNEEFNRIYRGLERVKHGKFKSPDRPAYLDATSLEPINDKTDTVQRYCSYAYHGGYNGCSEVGYFPFETYDYDLKNAYPTAMCLVPDIDWDNPVLNQIQNQNLTLQHFMVGGGFNPLMPFVGYISFKFPSNVKYPSIPINVEGVPVYPLDSKGIHGVYAAGSFIYLALRLGAEVYCENGYFLRTRLTDDMKESRSLSSAVIQLVKDRNSAKQKFGKGSLEEVILKNMVNSGYGKNAQNVVDKSSWNAWRDLMVQLGCSAITNPASAMMTTSIVQCELIAAQNQIHELGYIACSVTTDGFISNCPEDVLKSLDLYGFRPYMEQARLFLTDGTDSEIWEAKHHQDDLVNFTTRGNVSLSSHGVCAHNSAKSGYESDSYDDRLWLMTSVLSRTGTVDYTDKKWVSFKEMVTEGKDFSVTDVTRHIHMDFDLKRKPDRSSFKTDYPVIDNVTYEIAHFDTIPYENIDEFKLYRKKKKLVDCLRTQDDWKTYFFKVDSKAQGMTMKDKKWAILMSVVMGYRSHKYSIPQLDSLSGVQEKCDWINKFNESTRVFKPYDWKNARRPERIVNMLPNSITAKKLKEMQNGIQSLPSQSSCGSIKSDKKGVKA